MSCYGSWSIKTVKLFEATIVIVLDHSKKVKWSTSKVLSLQGQKWCWTKVTGRVYPILPEKKKLVQIKWGKFRWNEIKKCDMTVFFCKEKKSPLKHQCLKTQSSSSRPSIKKSKRQFWQIGKRVYFFQKFSKLRNLLSKTEKYNPYMLTEILLETSFGERQDLQNVYFTSISIAISCPNPSKTSILFAF